MKQNQITKRYAREFTISMIAYAVILVASISAIKNIAMTQPLKVIVSLAPVVPVTFVLIAVMRSVRDSDELQQRVHLLATTFAAVMTGLVTFTYGFLENIGFPKFSTFLVLPMLFFFWGISLAWFTKRYQ
jgi:hypothetical protein